MPTPLWRRITPVGRREAIYHAVMLDPLTAAVRTLLQVRAMVTELLAAQLQWLPQFQI